MTAPSPLRAVLQLLVCVGGIYGAYITQGFVQEALSTKEFGADKARFPHLSTLNAFQSWACFLWAALLLRLQTWWSPPK
jgi:UDP-galactose transporter B1